MNTAPTDMAPATTPAMANRPLHPRERAERFTRWVVTAIVALILVYGFQ
ncbi:MAG: hypothetical protein ACI80K_002990 [Paracoccaceae bacterium]